MTKLRLKELREQENLTQQEIATIFDTPRQNYARWELNKNHPNVDMLIKIADFYKVSLDFLCNHKAVGGYDVGYLSEQQRQLVELIKSLNETNTIKAFGYLAGLLAGQ